MAGPLRRIGLFALYQASIALGIALLPVAVAVRRVGIALPVHRVVQRLGDAYDRAGN